MVENLWKDLRYAARALSKKPAFTLVALLSLGLGIGVNTTIFSFVNAVLLRPMPVADPFELVHIYTGRPEQKHLTVSYPDYADLRDQNEVFSGMLAHAMINVSLTGAEGGRRPEIVLGEVVTGNYFDVLGIKPIRGRMFLPEEDETPNTHPVVVLSETLWNRRFGSDPEIVGKIVKLGPDSYTVVGIAPASFTGTLPGLRPDVFVPMMMEVKLSSFGIQDVAPSPGATRAERRGTRWLFVKARLKPDVRVEQAQVNLDSIMARLGQAYPDTNQNRSVTVLPASAVRIHPFLDDVLTPAASVLMAVVGIVLLIACANVANMLLSHATARRREMALRLALGATRGRIVRQLLTESLLLSLLGTATGLLSASWTLALLSGFRPPISIPIQLNLAFDVRVFLFAAGIAVLTGIAFGLAPALQASRPELVPALKDEAVALGRSRRFSFRDALVVAQVAGSLVLLVGAGLLVRSLVSARAMDLGFKPAGLALLDFNLKVHGYGEDQGRVFYRSLLERVRALPEVEAASLASRVPLSADRNLEGIFIDGRPVARPNEGIPIDAVSVESDYFRALGIPLAEGRDFGPEDREGLPAVVIINEAMARRFWPGESALSKRIRTDGPDGPTVEIVGVVKDYSFQSVGESSQPYLHFARAQSYASFGNLVVRGRGDAATLVASLRREVQGLDPNLVPSDELTMDEQISTSLFPVRMGATLLLLFGAMAMALAAVGLYGVISYSVSRRTREIGIRMALGAGAPAVRRLVVREGMTLAVSGVLVGLAGAAVGTRVLSGVLYGVGAMDPIAFGAAALLLFGVAFAANYIPARRASRVAPMRALRME